MRATVLISTLFLAAPAFPCTVFCVSDGKGVLVGNNEDYFDPATRMWFVPAGEGKHGRVYFGFANGFPQGGMNDAGLCFDGLALEREEVSSSLPGHDGNLADRAMAECATVEEVVALFGKYDRDFLAQAQLLFADRTGDAAVIEGNAVIRKKGRFLASTNFRVSRTEPAAANCDRYRISSRMLSEEGKASVDLCRRVLAATHQESPAATLYSNVYDLERGQIHLYHFHDYENVVVIDLAAELARGAHAVELSSLFPESYAFVEFRRRAEEKVAKRREAEAARDADRSRFGDFVGRYRFRDGPASGVEIGMQLEGDKLFSDLPLGGRIELTPRGGSAFAVISTSIEAELTFRRGADGAVTGFTVDAGGLKASAERLQ
jgi:hypothetical protein